MCVRNAKRRLNFNEPALKRLHMFQKHNIKEERSKVDHDGRLNYTRNTVFLSLLLMAYDMAVREGDGEGEELVSRFMLVVFRRT